MPVVSSFVTACAQVAGADADEVCNLRLATEETVMHIIETYPDPSQSDCFTLSCSWVTDGLEFNFEEKGLPIDTAMAWAYDASAPERMQEGLRFHLIRNVTDRFELKNQTRNGWGITFFKRIKAFRDMQFCPVPSSAPIPPKDGTPKTREPLTIVQAGKDDIQAVIELTYHTFRYTHDVEYYSRDMMEALIDNPYHVFNLVKTATGQVVASQEYYVDVAQTPDIVCYGTLMTHPDYRDGAAALKMIKKLKSDIEHPPHPGAKLWLQFLVTSHAISQRLAEMLGSTTCALALSYNHPMVFPGNLGRIEQRESYLISWLWLKVHRAAFALTCHCPPEHASIIGQIYAWQQMSIVTDCTFTPADSLSQEPPVWELKLTESARHGLILAKRLPALRETFGALLRRHKDEAVARGAVTIEIHVSSDAPLPDYFSTALREHGFFFSGIYPYSASSHALQYTNLCAQPFDFDRLQLYTENSRLLRDYVKAEYARL